MISFARKRYAKISSRYFVHLNTSYHLLWHIRFISKNALENDIFFKHVS